MLEELASRIAERYSKNNLAAIDPVTIMLIVEAATILIKAYIACKNKPEEVKERIILNHVRDRVVVNRAIKQAGVNKGTPVSTIEALRLRRAFFEAGKDFTDEEVGKAFKEVDNIIV